MLFTLTVLVWCLKGLAYFVALSGRVELEMGRGENWKVGGME